MLRSFKILLVLFLTLIPWVSYCQTDQDEIRKSFREYLDALSKQEFERSIEYIYPAVFEIIPKKTLLESMNALKSNAIAFSFDSATIINISKIMKVGKTQYGLMAYSYKMTLTFKNQPQDTARSASSRFDFGENGFENLKELYGDQNVRYDADDGRYNIYLSREMYVIKDPRYEGWRFLEKNESVNSFLIDLLPKKVIRKL